MDCNLKLGVQPTSTKTRAHSNVLFDFVAVWFENVCAKERRRFDRCKHARSECKMTALEEHPDLSLRKTVHQQTWQQCQEVDNTSC